MCLHSGAWQDVLESMARNDCVSHLGSRFWAERALAHVQRHLCCLKIQRIVDEPAAQSPAQFLEGALLLVSISEYLFGIRAKALAGAAKACG
jgi:hypothetical protein